MTTFNIAGTGALLLASLLVSGPAAAGPPKLPPARDTQVDEPPPRADPGPEAQSPSAKPARPKKPAPAYKKNPPPAPPPSEPPTPEPAPESTPDPLADEALAGDPTADPAPAAETVSTEAPRLGPDDEFRDPTELDDGEEGPRLPKLPPPPRPTFRGTGLYIGAGVVFAAAIAEQVAAHAIFTRDCIRPLATEDITDEDISELQDCGSTSIPALALRLEADLNLLLAIGLTAGGSAMRARRDGWDDVHRPNPKARKILAYEISGASLLAAGLVVWISSAAGTWGAITKCETVDCITGNRIAAFTLREVAAGMAATGAGLLTYGIQQPRRVYEYRALSVGLPRPTIVPRVGPKQAGLAISGRF